MRGSEWPAVAATAVGVKVLGLGFWLLWACPLSRRCWRWARRTSRQLLATRHGPS